MKKFIFALLFFCTSCASHWNYKNPQNWGNLSEEFKFCKIGYNQSPIDIANDFTEELKFSYNNSDIEKKPQKHNLQIEFDSRDFVLRGKKKYFIRRLEFHHPSEHLVKGAPHSLELQIYHKSDDEQWLVTAFLIEIGKENPAFNQLIKLLSDKAVDGKLDPSKLIKEDDLFFFYDGSFTTPPCKEGVKWYVAKTVINLSKEQMNQIIKQAIFAKANARPTQEFHPEKY